MSSQNNSVDMEILKEFQTESKNLIEELISILEKCEGDFSQAKSLETYGQTVDRIMGGAKSLGLEMNPGSVLHKIGDFTALCKAVSYKASQITDNPQFYEICVAFLLDATETLADMIDKFFETTAENFKDLFSQTFLDRLKWISAQFGSGYRSTVATPKDKSDKLSQNEIDDLLKKLGLV